MFKVFSATRKKFVEDWSLDRNETWYIVSDDKSVNGMARPVFSFLVHPDVNATEGSIGYDAQRVRGAVERLNSESDSINISRIAYLGRGKISSIESYRSFMGEVSDTEFVVVSKNWAESSASIHERATFLAESNRTEIWSIYNHSNISGSPRPIFSLTVRDRETASWVFDVKQVLNDARKSLDGFRIHTAPFFCLGVISTQDDVDRFRRWAWGSGL